MSLSTIFITVSAKVNNDFIDYPVNVANIMAYPPTNEKDVNTRIDLNAYYRPDGYVHLAEAYSASQVRTALFVKETPEEITQKIADAKAEQLKIFKKSGVAIIV
ncbi:MAG: hypothetical protein VX740_07430 [Pseudomonadota bacterium]|jgi:hypothetical protein|nr:hypothetical protein [Pseudomonadota bacterium]MED5423255.1 hypothetical protein [Pseudomonadota bacterium]MEE3323659.1 hypothetical protein [Pseudomonadota bacterium]